MSDWWVRSSPFAVDRSSGTDAKNFGVRKGTADLYQTGSSFMVENSATSVFVPVLVLVIIEISQAAREFDLAKIAAQKQEPFFYSVFYLLDRSSQDLIRIPQLGPFNFIHGMNLAILHLGFILVLLTSTGSVRIVVALILWLFWVLFPILEVYEYEIIMANPDMGPLSFLYHSIVTTTSAVFLFATREYLAVPIEEGGVYPETALVIIAVIGLYYASLLGYLQLLQRELEHCQ